MPLKGNCHQDIRQGRNKPASRHRNGNPTCPKESTWHTHSHSKCPDGQIPATQNRPRTACPPMPPRNRMPCGMQPSFQTHWLQRTGMRNRPSGNICSNISGNIQQPAPRISPPPAASPCQGSPEASSSALQKSRNTVSTHHRNPMQDPSAAPHQ